MRILFIDDLVNEMYVHKTLLEYSGHTVDIKDNLDWAYQHLSKPENQIRYDIVFIDEDFGQSSFNTSIKKGRELIEKLRYENNLCPLVYFSAVMDSIETVTKVLGSMGVCYFYDKPKDFDGRAEDCINEVLQLPNYKRIIELRTKTVDEELRKFFQGLSVSEAHVWKEEVEKRTHADWSKFEVIIYGAYYTINEILYNPINILSNEDITNKIVEYLKQSNRTIDFSKTFKADSADQYQKYINLKPEVLEATEYEISTIANNYFLNALSALNNYELNNEVVSLNNRNIAYSRATESIKKNSLNEGQKWHLFLIKMALRRVAALFYYNTRYLQEFDFDQDILSFILKEGYSHQEINGKRETQNQYIDAKIVWTWLGLSITILNRIKIDYDYKFSNPFLEAFLDEETSWVFDMAKKLPRVRKCLDDIFNEFLTDKDIKSFLPEKERTFTDLLHFDEWVKQIREELNSESYDKVLNIIKENSVRNNVNSYFSQYLPTLIAHFGAGRLGLGLVLPIIIQLGEKIIFINRYSEEWKRYKDLDILFIESNGDTHEFVYFNDDLTKEGKDRIKTLWDLSSKMLLIVSSDSDEDITFFLRDVQHITTSLKSGKGLNWAKNIINKTNLTNLVTIYPFENDRKEVDKFYDNLNEEQFEKSLLIADRVCTHIDFDSAGKKLIVYAEEYGNVVINGSKVNNLFASKPSIKGVDYIFCEDKDEFEFHFNKKFRILNCVHASLAVLCYYKLIEKKIKKEEWGNQYINLLNDGNVRTEIEKIATSEIIKLMIITQRQVLKKVFPKYNVEQVFNELKNYSDSIFSRFDEMADRLDRVLNLNDLTTKFDLRINDSIEFFNDVNNEKAINELIGQISNNKPNIRSIDTALRALLLKVSEVNRNKNG